MEKLWRIIRSYTAFTDPAVLFSMGSTPYWHMPLSTALNTWSKLWKYRMVGDLNSRSQAIWEYAPSTPWQATVGRWGKRSGVSSRACWMV